MSGIQYVDQDGREMLLNVAPFSLRDVKRVFAVRGNQRLELDKKKLLFLQVQAADLQVGFIYDVEPGGHSGQSRVFVPLDEEVHRAMDLVLCGRRPTSGPPLFRRVTKDDLVTRRDLGTLVFPLDEAAEVWANGWSTKTYAPFFTISSERSLKLGKASLTWDVLREIHRIAEGACTVFLLGNGVRFYEGPEGSQAWADVAIARNYHPWEGEE